MSKVSDMAMTIEELRSAAAAINEAANRHITQYPMVITTNVILTINGMKFAFAHNVYVYLRSYNSPYSVYKFEMVNSANVVKITMKGMSSIDYSPYMAY